MNTEDMIENLGFQHNCIEEVIECYGYTPVGFINDMMFTFSHTLSIINDQDSDAVDYMFENVCPHALEVLEILAQIRIKIFERENYCH